MLRLIGAVILALSCSAAGIALSYNLTRRVKLLEKIKLLIPQIQTLITYKNDKLRDVISQLNAEEYQEIISFRALSYYLDEGYNFESSWEKSINQLSARYIFDISEVELLVSFGKGLGKNDSEKQKEHCCTYLQLFDEKLSKAKRVRDEKSRLYISLGVLLGLALAILIL